MRRKSNGPSSCLSRRFCQAGSEGAGGQRGQFCELGVIRMRRIQTAVVVLALVAAFASGGCATQGEKMISSYAETRETLARANGQVDRTMAALSAVRTAPAGSPIQH